MPHATSRRPRRRTLASIAMLLALVACTSPGPPRDTPPTPTAPTPLATAPAVPPAADPAVAAILDSVPGIEADELQRRLEAPRGSGRARGRNRGRSPGPLLLDVRTPAEYAAGHVPGARNIPHDQLAQRLGELADARDREVIVYCRTGRRAASAIDTLRRAGFERPAHLRGDFQGWSAGGHPVATPLAEPAPP